MIVANRINIKKVFCVFLLTIVMVGCGNSEKPKAVVLSNDGERYVYIDEGFSISISKSLWDNMEFAYSEYETVTDFLEEAVGYVHDIVALTGETEWYSRYKKNEDGYVEITIKDTTQASHVEGGYNSKNVLEPTVYLNNEWMMHSMAPLAHELTHIICQDYTSVSLREGLASYVADEISDKPIVFNFGMCPHELSKNIILTDYTSVIKQTKLIGTFDEVADNSARSGYYILSYSFCKYLIDTYGLDVFMEVYSSKDELQAYENVYGKDYNQIKSDWLNYLEQFEGAISEEIYNENYNKILKEHGFEVE